MKYFICSDIHGDSACCAAMLDAYRAEGADRLLILGDILYHGPRNDLPPSYAPKEVIALLNPLREQIIAVRGNCDAEVDQMVLDFPIRADFAHLDFDGLCVFATHGHLFNTSTPLPLKKGEILLHGHTHILKFERFGNDNIYLNPGSITLPKEGNPKSYMVYENRTFTAKTMSGRVLFSEKI